MEHPLAGVLANAATHADELVRDRAEDALAAAFVHPSEISRQALKSDPVGDAIPDDTLDAILHRLSWCRANQNVCVTSMLGPATLDQRLESLPSGSRAEAEALGASDDDVIVRVIHDVRVQPGRKDRTDDAVYESDEVIRERVPRGLAFLEARAVPRAELAAVRASIAAGKDPIKAEAKLVTGITTAEGTVDADGVASVLASAKKVDADAAPLGRALRIDLPVRGLTKFTGGVGDDDDKLPSEGAAPGAAGSTPAWQRFFTADMSASTHVAVMGKANGESGHLGAVWDPWLGSFVAVAGSKNVHLAFRPTFAACPGVAPADSPPASAPASASASASAELPDAPESPDFGDPTWAQPRYAFALPMTRTVDGLLSRNARVPYDPPCGGGGGGKGAPPAPTSLAEALLHLLSTGRCTLCFEHLSPEWLHVERCGLEAPELVAIGWQSARLRAAPGLSRGLNPLLGRPLALALGLKAVSERLIPVSRLREQMAETRELYGVEGHVLYFVDSGGHVIGLLKKKAVWYIVARAFREKAKGMLSALERAAAVASGGRKASGAPAPAKQLEKAYRKWAGIGLRFGGGAEDEAPARASLAPRESPLHPSAAMAWASGAGGAASTAVGAAEAVRRTFHLRTAVRVADIQSWVRMSDEARLRWMALGHGLMEHCFREYQAGRMDAGRVSTAFPIVWDEFLAAAGEDDHVPVGAGGE